MPAASESEIGQPLAGLRVAFVGKLGGMTKRDAQRLVRENGGVPVDRPQSDTHLIIIGADELPLPDCDELLDEATQDAVAEGRVEIIGETQLWQRLGMFEVEQNSRLYTPAMLAELLGVSVATIRRWHRRRLIVPAREVNRLPYFDFQEVSTARRLAELLTAGASAAAIEKKLAELARFMPEVERPLAQLAVIVEGKQLLLRQGEGLVEPSGQMRIDFDALVADADDDASADVATLPFAAVDEFPELTTPDEMLEYAAQLEDEDELEAAADMYRATLAAAGPRPEVCFQLAEVLYRLGDLSAARERYYMTIELDEDYVEARANLGCVLAETGQLDLAVAAFQGALEFHEDYPDVHYHLARTFDELARHEEAIDHWQRFLLLAPGSPWADEALDRLGAED